MRRLLVNLLVALNATQFADVTLLDKSCDSCFSKINLIDKKIKSISLIFDIFFHDQTIFIKDCELYITGHSLNMGIIIFDLRPHRGC